jgi:hypothetical protein
MGANGPKGRAGLRATVPAALPAFPAAPPARSTLPEAPAQD